MINNYKKYIKESLLDNLSGPTDEELLKIIYIQPNLEIGKYLLNKGVLTNKDFNELEKYYFDIKGISIINGQINSNDNDYLKDLLNRKIIDISDIFDKLEYKKLKIDEKLIIAIGLENLDAVKYFVIHGAEVDTPFSNPVKYACYIGNTEIFNYLYKKSKDDNIYGYNLYPDSYLINTATKLKHYGIFETLLDNNILITGEALRYIEEDYKLNQIYQKHKNKKEDKKISKFRNFFNKNKK